MPTTPPRDERDLIALATDPADQMALVAHVDVLDRRGGTRLDYGRDGGRGWWASVHLAGARLTAEAHPTVTAAVDALVHQALTGAKCALCDALIAHNDGPAAAFGTPLIDGSPFTTGQAAATGTCRWRRFTVRWIAGCVAPVPTPGWEPTDPTTPPPAGVDRWSHLALADVLTGAGAPTDLIALTAGGYFHPYRSPLPRPEVMLMGWLTRAGLGALSARVLAGDFTADPAERMPAPPALIRSNSDKLGE